MLSLTQGDKGQGPLLSYDKEQECVDKEQECVDKEQGCVDKEQGCVVSHTR